MVFLHIKSSINALNHDRNIFFDFQEGPFRFGNFFISLLQFVNSLASRSSQSEVMPILRFLVYQNTALFSTFLHSSVRPSRVWHLNFSC